MISDNHLIARFQAFCLGFAVNLSQLSNSSRIKILGLISLTFQGSQSESILKIYLFWCWHLGVQHSTKSMYLLTVSIKGPGPDFLKKSLLNNQYYLLFKFYKPKTTMAYNRNRRLLTIFHFDRGFVIFSFFKYHIAQVQNSKNEGKNVRSFVLV